jgi:PAS domain S-box-containing protein
MIEGMTLEEFARFIREHHLEEFAREELRLLVEFDVPLLRQFAHLPADELQRMTMASAEVFLADLEAGRALERAMADLRRWEAGNLPGIERDSIQPQDLVLVYAAQKAAMLRFLAPFTQDVGLAVRVVGALEEHFRKVQEAAFETFASLRDDIIGQAARARGEAEATRRYADALRAGNAELQAANEELTSQAEELAAQQGELQRLYNAIQVQNERLEATVAERTRDLAKQASLLQLAQDAIFVRDWEAGTVTFWNRGAESLYGWTQEEAMGRPVHGLLKTVFPRPLSEVRATLEQTDRWEGELIHTGKDGARLVVASRWALQRDAEGRPQAILEINTDQTEQKRAEQQRRLFELMVRNISDYAIYMLDPLGHVISWNEGAQKLKGYTEAEIVGRHFSVFFPPDAVEAHKPERLLERARQAGHEEDEGLRVRKDGSTFWADAILTTIYDDDTLVGFAKITRDLTAQKQAEEALRANNEELQAANEELSSQAEELQAQQEEVQLQADELARQRRFLENLVRNLPLAIALLDEDLTYRVVNPAWEHAERVDAAHVVGRRLLEVPPHFPEVAERARRVLATGEKLWFTAVPSTLEGGTYWDLVFVPSTESELGGVEGVIVVALDVTDRVEREQLQHERIETMERVDTLKDQFLSILSHELRTPINAIMGFGSILEDGLVGPMGAEQTSYLRKMLGGAETLLALVNDLLDMSRIQAGKFSLEPGAFNFQDLAAEVSANMAPLAEQKHLTLLSEVSQDLSDVVADKQRVSQVLTNLINNAIKFTEAGGTITVRAFIERRSLRCEVEDTGIGITAADQAKLFQRFSQLDTSNTRRTSGTGLGLSIVKALVEAHVGAVGVESTPGEGSTFWFTLPLDPVTAESA